MKLRQGTLLRELQSIVGKKHAFEPKDASYEVDGLAPTVVAEPGTYKEVAEVLRFANSERFAVVPRSGGHQMQLGNLPSRYDVALSLARLDKVIDHEPADLTVTCQAGMTAGALGSHLARWNQMVPLALDPAAPLSVGGLLSLNTSELRAVYGAPRDFTIGLRAITADGRITRAGGKVVKNVAGYDLCKLYIGSRGTLAVIVDATFKLFPRPQVFTTTSFQLADCSDACGMAGEARAKGLCLIDAHVIPYPEPPAVKVPPDSYFLHLAFAGEPSTIEHARGEVRELAVRFNGKETEWPLSSEKSIQQGESPTSEHPLSVRAHLLPTQVPDFIGALMHTADGWFDAAPLIGEVAWTWTHDGDPLQRIEAARTAASRLGGALEVQICPPELKPQIDIFGPAPPSFPLMRAIKQEFDPNNVLSPGRFMGRL